MDKANYSQRLLHLALAGLSRACLYLFALLMAYSASTLVTHWEPIKVVLTAPTAIIFFFLAVVFRVTMHNKDRMQQKNEKSKNDSAKVSMEQEKIKAESKNQMGGKTIAAETVYIYERDENKKGSKEVLTDYDEITSLMNRAIEDTLWACNGIQLAGEPDLKEKFEIAFQSDKGFHVYFNDHRHHFSLNERGLLEELDNHLASSIRMVHIASKMGNAELWYKESQKCEKKAKSLREQIIEEFRKNVAK